MLPTTFPVDGCSGRSTPAAATGGVAALVRVVGVIPGAVPVTVAVIRFPASASTGV